MRSIYDAPEITHPGNVEDIFGSEGFEKKKPSADRTYIGDPGFKPKDVFYYLFDFGDEWWHRIRVQRVDETSSPKKHLEIIKSVGDSPPQYPDYDDEYE